MVELTFWGAARTVTGSQHGLTVDGRRYLLDCGLFQGRRQEAYERNRSFAFPPETVEAVVLSHAHIDHCGNLPTLVKDGFTGPILTSPATADLCGPMLRDSGHIQEGDVAFLNKRLKRRLLLDESIEDGELEPLYTAEDAARVLTHFRPVPLRTPTPLGDGITVETWEAGHMLGSTSPLLTIEESAGPLRLLFSGDVGRPGLPILRDPELAPPADYLIVESTYGNRLHPQDETVTHRLEKLLVPAIERRARIVVPAFAVGRTQQLVLLLHDLIERGRIPAIPMFVDSPLAVNVTEVFRQHTELYDEETAGFLQRGGEPFGFQRLRYIRSVAESKALNDRPGPYLVIASSGMCEAGRVLHHLAHTVSDERNLILLTGFQAENTLGRKIADRHREVPIFGQPHRLRAEVASLRELSGHADQRELLRWMTPAARELKAVFLVHGEHDAQEALAQAIRERFNLKVYVPERGQRIKLA